jgi:hypothetical protein
MAQQAYAPLAFEGQGGVGMQPLSDHYATRAKAYRDGTGVNVDLMKSYIWFSIAAQIEKGEAQTERDKIAARLTASQLIEAQNLVRKMHCT